MWGLSVNPLGKNVQVNLWKFQFNPLQVLKTGLETGTYGMVVCKRLCHLGSRCKISCDLQVFSTEKWRGLGPLDRARNRFIDSPQVSLPFKKRFLDNNVIITFIPSVFSLKYRSCCLSNPQPPFYCYCTHTYRKRERERERESPKAKYGLYNITCTFVFLFIGKTRVF